mgnify:FL=1
MKFLYVRIGLTQSLAIPASSVVGIYQGAQRQIDIYFNSLGSKNKNSGKIELTGISADPAEYVRIIKDLSRVIASDSGNMFITLADTVTGEFFDDDISTVTVSQN